VPDREALFEELLRYATSSEDVLAVYVFGSRGRADGLADERSDYDVGVVLRDEADLAAFDARWPYTHGAPVEIARATLSELRTEGDRGTPSAWSRPLYGAVDLRLDKTGEVAGILEAKRTLEPEARDAIMRESLDAYINSTYRSLRYRLVGAGAGVRLDAAAAVPPLLDFLFAVDGRVRPFNKYLEAELAERPLAGGSITTARLLAILDADVEEQHAVFCDMEHVARAHGLGAIVDAWEPDVAWLRGDEPYRAG
jgi:predicted nucleotidyltransferase